MVAVTIIHHVYQRSSYLDILPFSLFAEDYKLVGSPKMVVAQENLELRQT